MNRASGRLNFLLEINVPIGVAQHLAGPKRFLFTLLKLVVARVRDQLFCCLR